MGRPSLINDGDIIELKNGFVQVIRYEDHKTILVRPFKNEVIAEDTPYWTTNSNLKYKWSTTPFDRTLYNVGYRGVGDYKCRKYSSVHTHWANMLKRCYCTHDRIYENITVCDEWHNFQNFSEWFYENYTEGFVLDKDLLTDSQIYSPDTCCFIPTSINNAIIHHNNKGLPSGVSYCKQTGKYSASISVGNERVWGGRHKTIDQAFNTYLELKNEHLNDLAEKYKSELSSKVYESLLSFTERRIRNKYE